MKSFKDATRFSRSDLILESKQWSKNIIAKINDEFDADSKESVIRKHSETVLQRELSFAEHVIPFAYMLMKVTSSDTTNLSRLIVSNVTKG